LRLSNLLKSSAVALEEPPIQEEESVPMTELHPAAVLACFSSYFRMAYPRQNPLALPKFLDYDELVFWSEANVRENVIELYVRDKAGKTSVTKFAPEQFKRLYVE
jgi:hypothetical protein